MNRRSSLGLFVVLGLAVTLVFAFFVSPVASGEPDGLERVAIDQGFVEQARDHDLAGGPLADYTVAGVESERLSTGLSGVVGVLLCFALAAGLILLVRVTRRGRSSSATTSG